MAFAGSKQKDFTLDQSRLFPLLCLTYNLAKIKNVNILFLSPSRIQTTPFFLVFKAALGACATFKSF